MPLLKLETTVTLPAEKQRALLASLSQTVAATIGKPESYVMVTFSPAAILMAGEDGPAAFVDLRSIGGLTSAVNARLAAQICRCLTESLGIPGSRIYLNFTDVKAANWGCDGSTFG